MSPQGLQAQATIAQLRNYSPARDTKNQSLWKLLQKRATGYLESGVLPENERLIIKQEYSSAVLRSSESRRAPATAARRQPTLASSSSQLLRRSSARLAA